MKKTFLLLLLICCNTLMNAQATSEVTAEGKASSKIKPDMITVKISVRKENEAESQALKDLNLEMDVVQKFLSKAGIPSKQIKISNFSVNGDNRYNSGKKLFTAVASLSVDMKIDYKLLDALYSEIQSDKYKDVSINYETYISDALQNKTRMALTQTAVAEARKNADNIAKALGVKITGVKNASKSGTNLYADADNELSFGYQGISYETVPQTIFSKFEVEEKELSESITIVFEIAR